MGLLTSGVALLNLPKAQAEESLQAKVDQAMLQEVSMEIPQPVIDLRRAIIGQESGGKFQAVNPYSGALGYGQVMPENVGPWSKEALGYSVSTTQFLNDPALQLKIIDFKLKQYWQAAIADAKGDEVIAVRRVASHWYSGKPYRYSSTRAQYYGGHRYPSIAEYTLEVLARYQKEQQYMLQASTNLRNSLPLEAPLVPGMN